MVRVAGAVDLASTIVWGIKIGAEINSGEPPEDAAKWKFLVPGRSKAAVSNGSLPASVYWPLDSQLELLDWLLDWLDRQFPLKPMLGTYILG